MPERMWYLKHFDLFGQLSHTELRWLELQCRYRRIGARRPVYLPSEDATGVLLLISGRVKICTLTAEGKQGILAFVEPGEVFGELALIDEARREEYAEAIEPSEVALIHRDAIQQLLDRQPGLSLHITRLIGLRRRRIERRLKYLLFHSNRSRLVHLLVELAEQYGRRVPGGIDMGIRLSHQDLASVIGSTRETVTVLLGKLQAEQKLKVRRKTIILTDLDSLREDVDVGRAERAEEPFARTR